MMHVTKAAHIITPHAPPTPPPIPPPRHAPHTASRSSGCSLPCWAFVDRRATVPQARASHPVALMCGLASQLTSQYGASVPQPETSGRPRCSAALRTRLHAPQAAGGRKPARRHSQGRRGWGPRRRHTRPQCTPTVHSHLTCSKPRPLTSALKRPRKSSRLSPSASSCTAERYAGLCRHVRPMTEAARPRHLPHRPSALPALRFWARKALKWLMCGGMA
jgi:hypothetical protein